VKLVLILVAISLVGISLFTRRLILRTLVVIFAIVWAYANLYFYTFGRNAIEAKAQKGIVPQAYVDGVTDAEISYRYIRDTVSIVLAIVLLIMLRSVYDVYAARSRSNYLHKESRDSEGNQ
jgi:hypothetical protein